MTWFSYRSLKLKLQVLCANKRRLGLPARFQYNARLSISHLVNQAIKIVFGLCNGRSFSRHPSHNGKYTDLLASFDPLCESCSRRCLSPLQRAINLIERLPPPKALDFLYRVSLSTLKNQQEAGRLNNPHFFDTSIPPFLDESLLNFLSRFTHRLPSHSGDEICRSL